MHGMKEDAKSEAKEPGVDKDSAEHGHITVTNLGMVNRELPKLTFPWPDVIKNYGGEGGI